MKISFCIILVILFISFAKAQKPSVKLYSKPYKDSIGLRWQISDPVLWETNIKRGYDVYRKSQNGTVQKINDTVIRACKPIELMYRYLKLPPPLDSTIEEKNIPDSVKVDFKMDTLALKAVILQFPKEVGLNDNQYKSSETDMIDFGDDPRAVRWLFHSLICLEHKEAAIVSGLFYMDKNVKRGQRYTYYLCNGGDSWDKAIASTELASDDSYLFQPPLELKDFTDRRSTFLSWKKVDTLSVFIPVYYVVKSEKPDGPFTQVNKEAVLAVYGGKQWRDSTRAFYNDTKLEKSKVYYYKIQGQDIFGDRGPFSKVIKVTEKSLIRNAPYIYESKMLTNPFACSVSWKVNQTEEEDIALFRVYKSSNPDTLFIPCTQDLKSTARTFIDKKPQKNNYYKLMTVGKAGDTLWTSPAYVLIPDSIPPNPPVMISGICDSLGIVTLKWKFEKESDVSSFKLFRANYSHEEYSRIANINNPDSIYKDSVSLKTLTRTIHYKLIAYDDSYNPSEFSNSIKVVRYDIIPPTAPVFSNFRSDSSGIRLTWGNSSSDDVLKTVLFRKTIQGSEWQTYKTFAFDTADYATFIDTVTIKGSWYQYKLQSYDQSGLSSDYSDTVTLKAYDDGFRKPVSNVTSKQNIRKRIVKLSWDYSNSEVELFQIYRANEDGIYSIYQSVAGTKREMYDTELSAGRMYRYRIKAVYQDGGESPLSKEIEVKF